MFPYVESIKEEHLLPLDKQILYEVDKLIKMASAEYDTLDFFYTTNNIKNFIWNVYASHYLELVKNRAYNFNNIFSEEEQHSAWYTLHKTLKTILLLLHPVAPFVTDYIWRKLYCSKGILSESFPEPSDIRIEPKFNMIMKLDSIIWKFKESNGLSLKDSISKAIISSKLKEFYMDLKVTHKIDKIKFVDGIEIEETKLYL